MKSIFFNPEHRLRNGWWAVLFLIALVLFGFAQVGVQWACAKAHLPGGPWFNVIGTLAVLGATWSVLKLRQESFATLGFDLNRRWAREFACGSAIGIIQMLVAVLAVRALGGVRLELDPARSLQAVSSGLMLFVLVSIKEETLFRGFLFQRLRDGMGLWPTQFLLASFFALAHWANPGMHGATKFWATLDIFIGAMVFGMAYVRTGSLALPIGIHLGWNWMQGHVLGFGVSGNQFSHGWLRPSFLGKPEWLTGGTFGIEASVFAVVVDLLLLSLLIGWKGSIASEPIDSPAPASASAAPRSV